MIETLGEEHMPAPSKTRLKQLDKDLACYEHQFRIYMPWA